MNNIEVPWLDWLPNLSTLRAAEVLLYWSFAGIAACALALTLLLCLRDRWVPVSVKRFTQRVAAGQFIILGAVLLCAGFAIFQWVDNDLVNTEIRVIWHSASCGLVLGWVFSAAAAALHILLRKRWEKSGTEPDPRRSTRMTVLAFAFLLLLGLVNRYTLFLPRLLSKGEFKNDITWMDSGVGVYRIDIGVFDVGIETDTDVQRSELLVYAEPSRRAEVVAELPTGTSYGYHKVIELSLPTTRWGWRYLPEVKGYAPTLALLRAFWNSMELFRDDRRNDDPDDSASRKTWDAVYTGWQDARQIVNADEYAFITGQAVTHDACFWMSPLSLLAWVAGLIAAPLAIPRKNRRKRTKI